MVDDPPSRTFTVTPDGRAPGEVGHILLPFDATAIFGRARPAVVVEVNGHRFRSTVAMRGGAVFVPFRRSAREAAGVADGTAFTVTLTLDTVPRMVAMPDDLRAALDAAGVGERWSTLGFTHRREHVEAIEQAKKPDTRARRIGKCVEMVGG